MKRGCGRTCGCDDLCPRAEAMVDDRERDDAGWMADREADRFEREVLGL